MIFLPGATAQSPARRQGHPEIRKMKTIYTIIAAAAALVPAVSGASCGAAFCAVNSNWTAESALAEAPRAFDVRYEYLNQDQPIAGTRKVYAGEVRAHHDEVSTRNRNVVLSYSQNLGRGFGVTVSAAAGQREHFHIHNHHGAKIEDRWDIKALSDVRVVGRYKLALALDPLRPANAGVTFGLKLPTGKFDETNSHGDKAERSLQPGTGTTDLIVGGYYHRKLVEDGASWFAQAQYQHALNERDGFRPGSQLGIDLGLRQGFHNGIGLMGQLNYVLKRSDSGSEAEPASSGGRYVYASPGVSVALPANMQLYAFYQVPVYRNLKGVQLSANRALVVGLSGQL